MACREAAGCCPHSCSLRRDPGTPSAAGLDAGDGTALKHLPFGGCPFTPLFATLFSGAVCCGMPWDPA